MTGRFISPDTHINANGDLQGYNLYAYCSNNPIMHVDPTGEGFLLLGIFLIATTVIGAVSVGIKAYNEGERGLELIDDILLGSVIGLAAGGAVVSTAAVVTGAIMGGAAATFIFGTPVLQTFAIGALAVNSLIFGVVPLYGQEGEGIEFEMPSSPILPPTPTMPVIHPGY